MPEEKKKNQDFSTYGTDSFKLGKDKPDDGSKKSDDKSIILNIPPLTEERRKDLVKVVKRLAEEAKISVRQLRQDAQAGFKKKKQNDEMTEDELHGAEKKLQEAVDLENAKIEELTVSKEKAVMTV